MGAARALQPQWPQGDYASPPTFAVTRALASACLPMLAGVGHEVGIPRSGVAVLLLAWRSPMTPGTLAATLGMTPSAMTTVVADLAAAGLATRDTDPDDGRRAIVATTEAGQDALLAALRPLRVQLDEVDQRFGGDRSRVGRTFIVRCAQALETGYGLDARGPEEDARRGDTLMAVLRFATAVPPMLAVLADSLGISRSEMDAMLVFAERASGPGDLALRLGLTPSAGSQVVERLTARGLVTKAQDPADRRRVVIALSDAFLTRMAERTLGFQQAAQSLDAASDAAALDMGRAFMDAVVSAVRHVHG